MSRPDPVALMAEVLSAYNDEDWSRFRAGLADDLTVADHRPAPSIYDGISGPDEFIAALQPLFGLASGVSVRTIAIHVVGMRGAVFQLSTVGVTADGGDFELAFNLAYVVASGRLSRLEFFDDDRLADACARAKELMG